MFGNFNLGQFLPQLFQSKMFTDTLPNAMKPFGFNGMQGGQQPQMPPQAQVPQMPNVDGAPRQAPITGAALQQQHQQLGQQPGMGTFASMMGGGMPGAIQDGTFAQMLMQMGPQMMGMANQQGTQQPQQALPIAAAGGGLAQRQPSQGFMSPGGGIAPRQIIGRGRNPATTDASGLGGGGQQFMPPRMFSR